MHHAAVTGMNLDRAHPLVLRQVDRQNHVLIIDLRVGRNLERMRQADHHAGAVDLPVVGPLDGTNRVLFLSFQRSARHPLVDGRDLLRLQDVLGRKFTAAFVGEPGRHFLRLHRIDDRLRPRPDLFIGNQWHRPDFARPVAGLAARLQNGQDFFIKCRRGRGRARAGQRRQQQRHLEQMSYRTQEHLDVDHQR